MIESRGITANCSIDCRGEDSLTLFYINNKIILLGDGKENGVSECALSCLPP
jgi:hypothetical protein